MHGPAVVNYHNHYHCKRLYSKTGTFAGYTVHSRVFVAAFCVLRNVTTVPGTNSRKLALCVQRSYYCIFVFGNSNFCPKIWSWESVGISTNIHESPADGKLYFFQILHLSVQTAIIFSFVRWEIAVDGQKYVEKRLNFKNFNYRAGSWKLDNKFLRMRGKQ